MDPDQNWFYLHGNERKGPFDLTTIRQLLEAGVIAPDTWVAKQGDSDWISARQAASGSAITLPPPPASSSPSAEHHQTSDTAAKGSSVLYWAAAPLLAFFVSGVAFWQKVGDMRFSEGSEIGREMSKEIPGGIHTLTPKVAPDLPQEIIGALLLFGFCLIPGALFCGFHKKNSAIRAKGGRLSTSRRVFQGILWVLVVIGCMAVSFHATTTRTYALLSMLERFGIGGTLYLRFTATLAILALLSLYALRLARSQRKQAEQNGVPPGRPPLIAASWSKITILLILLSAVLPVACWFQVSSRRNPDEVFVERMIKAIDQAERETEILTRVGDMKMADTFALVTPPVISNIEIGGHLDEILKDCPEIFMKDGTPLDTWNRLPFRVALDSNGDRAVDLGGRKLEARAVVWSVGFNGKDELGAGDDVVRTLK